MSSSAFLTWVKYCSLVTIGLVYLCVVISSLWLAQPACCCFQALALVCLPPPLPTPNRKPCSPCLLQSCPVSLSLAFYFRLKPCPSFYKLFRMRFHCATIL